MKRFACDSCGAPIKSSRCEYCQSKIDDFKMQVLKNKDEWLKLYDEVLLNKIRTGQKFTQHEDEIFCNLLKYGLIPDEKLETELIILNAFYGNKLITYETFEEYMTSLFELNMKQLNFNRIKNYDFTINIDRDKNSTRDGCELFARIFEIKQENIENVYNGNLSGLIVFFHEMWHGFQEISIMKGQVNDDLMIMIKDFVIRKYTKYDKDVQEDFYYKRNYRNISYEIDAQDKAVEIVRRFIETHKLSVPKEALQMARELYGSDIHNTDRVIIIDGKEVTMSQDEILDNVIRNHPEALNDFVQLNLEYIIDGSEVRRKTVDELQDSLTKTNDAILISYIEKQIEKQIEVRA